MPAMFARCFPAVALAMAAAALAPPALAQSTAFTYQGRLDDAGAPSQGLHDFRFLLFDAPEGGVVVGTPVCADDVDVVDGVFTAQLDFGPQFAAMAERHLEVAVRLNTGLSCADLTGFVTLVPRQQVTAAPRATHANSAYALDAADGVPASAVYVDDAGRVGVGTTSPAAPLHVRSAGPFLVLQDTASASNQAGYLGFWNDASAETGWIGFGTPGSPHFSIVNARSGGSIVLEALAITSSGNVGIGTTSPGTKLDVRGDIRLGPTGQFQAPAGEERLRILRGRIASNGGVSVGSGFTSSRTSTGVYLISFGTSFSSTPVVTVSATVAATGGPFIAHTNGVTTHAAGVRITNGSGSNIDDSFEFIAIGPR